MSPLSIVERLHPRALDCAAMHENIPASVIRLDEAKALWAWNHFTVPCGVSRFFSRYVRCPVPHRPRSARRTPADGASLSAAAAPLVQEGAWQGNLGYPENALRGNPIRQQNQKKPPTGLSQRRAIGLDAPGLGGQ